MKSLPVLMHHYIHNFTNSIAVSVAHFEDQCRGMAEAGWRGISLAQAEGYFLEKKPLPQKSALITFDDGYFDTYCCAMPLLHKYGHKGVLFSVTDQAEASAMPRICLQDALAGKGVEYPFLHEPIRKDMYGDMVRSDLFCNESELRAMDTGGTVAVAGHASGHLGVFTGAEYTGFMERGQETRTFYLTSYGEIFGLPLFPIKPALSNRAFLPNPDLLEAIQRLVPQNKEGSIDFFAKETNSVALQQLVSSFADKMGRMETDAEMRARMEQEITASKKKLENILGHSVQTLCWPWGEWSELAMHIAKEAGYKVFLTTQQGANKPGAAEAVKRFKVRSKSASWLLSRLSIYSRPILGEFYARIRF